jgi:rod shape-determining protein MreD
MLKNIILFTILFWLLILIQASFLVHFNIFSGTLSFWTPNLALIAIVLINFFEKPERKSGILAAFIGGFFLDVFSGNFFGLFTLIALGLAVFFKFILKNYLQLEFFSKRHSLS